MEVKLAISKSWRQTFDHKIFNYWKMARENSTTVASFLFVAQELLLVDSIITFLCFFVPSVEDSPGEAEICFSRASGKLNV